jgi:hypothetical protein
LGGNLTIAGLASSGTQCLHVSAAGLLSGTGADCGSGVGGSTWGSITGTLASQIDLQTALDAKESITNKATDFSIVNNTLYPTVQAAKAYTDSKILGLLNYRGGYDASGNTYPITGGSGGGVILKGDTFVISIAGTLGGNPIQVGDSIIANVDSPGQTSGNWNTLNTNISYVPENAANKVTSISGASTDTQYPSAKLLFDQLALKQVALVSGTNIKTINGITLLGSGDLAVGGGTVTGVSIASANGFSGIRRSDSGSHHYCRSINPDQHRSHRHSHRLQPLRHQYRRPD